MTQTIADYVASLRLRPDLASLKKADRFFSLLESKIARYTKKINKNGSILGVGQTVKGITDLQRAEDKRTKASIGNIDKLANAQVRAYNKELQALQKKQRLTKSSDLMNSHIPAFRQNQATLRKQLIEDKKLAAQIRADNRKQTAMDKMHGQALYMNRMYEQRRNSSPTKPVGAFAAGSYRNIGTLAGAGIAGFGLNSLNRAVRELEMLPVALEAVTGSSQRAAKELEYLNTLGNEIGATTRAIAPSYTKFLASAIGSPLEGQAQTTFRSTLRYSKIVGMDKEALKGTLRAITQIANKQKMMAEEVTGQLGEHAPGVIRMLAGVATNGDTKELFKQMEAGKLDPNILLPKLAAEMEKVAKKGEGKWKNSAGFQQDLAEKKLEDSLKVFSSSGGNSGWLKIWTTFAETLPKMAPLFRAAGQGFDYFADKFRGVGDIISGIGMFTGQIQKMTSSTEDMSARIGQLAPFLAAAWKKSFAPLYGAYLIIQDIAGYSMGMKSVTGMAFDYLQGKGGDKLNAPKNLARINPWQGQLAGGAVFAAKTKYEQTGTGLDALRYYGARVGNAGMEHMLRPIIDFSTWALSPNTESNRIRLTPQAQMDSIINNIAYGGNTGVGGLPPINVTINSANNDPQHLANLVTKEITTRTIPFLLRNNGE